MESQSRFRSKPLHLLSAFFASFLLVVPVEAKRAGSLELYDGDRVVFIGNTFVERAIEYGQIEAALSVRWPDRRITFRNLGWSGDDARGRARRFFGPVEDGFNHLKSHVEDLKPTVLFVVYGAMEAYDGQAGRPEFRKHMNRLLAMLEKSGARIALVSTIPQEKMGPPLPDPKENNRNLQLYSKEIQLLAKERDHWFIDLFSFMEEAYKRTSDPLTDNGIHLNDAGYRMAAEGFLSGMGFPFKAQRVSIDAQGRVLASEGSQAPNVQPLGNGLLLTLMDDQLPGDQPMVLSIRDLFSGDYSLKLNGRNLGTYSAQDWAKGVELPWTPNLAQKALLLDTIRIKNEYFFHKWRPQNETYLRGFRSHEQGRNAAELEQFDPYIEREEDKIADLKHPRPYTLQLHRETEN